MAAPNTGAVVEVNGLSAGSTREKLHPYLLGITIDWEIDCASEERMCRISTHALCDL
jgi:hypothetical protein